MDRPTRGGGQYVDTRRVHHYHPPVYRPLPLSLTRHDTIVTIHSNLLTVLGLYVCVSMLLCVLCLQAPVRRWHRCFIDAV